MTGLLIFTAAMLAGCIFLIYFLVALWRDGHKQRKGPRVEIIKLPSRGGFMNNRSADLLIFGAEDVLDETDLEPGFRTVLHRRSSK
jgi:hypothetical protein